MNLSILCTNRTQVLFTCLFAAASIYSKPLFATPENSVERFADSIIVQKQLNNKKHRINIYPDAGNEVLFFNVISDEQKKYQLYVFDIEGKLVRQANIFSNQTTVLKKFPKGIYLFDVFSDDKRIENGQVVFQ
jgi:hypothetical protein